MTDGGVFVLFTSHAALARVHRAAAPGLEALGLVPMRQGGGIPAEALTLDVDRVALGPGGERAAGEARQELPIGLARALGPGRLEKTEKLEQLRLLENGIPIRTVLTRHRSLGVDRPEDIDIVARWLTANPKDQEP